MSIDMVFTMGLAGREQGKGSGDMELDMHAWYRDGTHTQDVQCWHVLTGNSWAPWKKFTEKLTGKLTAYMGSPSDR